MSGDHSTESPSLTVRARDVLASLRDWPTARWLWLAVVADLLVDVLTGFLALYLVDVAHLRPELAALAIAIRLGSALAGDAALVFVLERVSDLVVLRVSAVAAALRPLDVQIRSLPLSPLRVWQAIAQSGGAARAESADQQ